jgi:hypothetical protein
LNVSRKKLPALKRNENNQDGKCYCLHELSREDYEIQPLRYGLRKDFLALRWKGRTLNVGAQGTVYLIIDIGGCFL